jgi:hypothetical protein
MILTTNLYSGYNSRPVCAMITACIWATWLGTTKIRWSISPPVHSLSLPYTSLIPLLQFSMSMPYRGSWLSTYQISYPFSELSRARKSVYFRGPCKYFATIFLWWVLLAPRPTPSLKATPCTLSATAYSIYSQLPSMSGGRLLYPQHEDTPCRGDKGLNVVIRTRSKINVLNILPNICIFQLILLDYNGDDFYTSHGCMWYSVKIY